ncbi:glucose/galactose MFS transporter [Kozakia baliensis]|uniref:Glucose/galactose transporter n=1 Tax=Kozakia baliensis TaxID=153496 RepID=A0A1D8UZ66_9PROT|nr:glucose/galactose MFS transporter [Kozakia baliensis]AOX18857.1 glucose/galactose transporter [Kozakia baliensis]
MKNSALGKNNSLVGEHGLGALAIAALIFFAMGFVTWLNGPLISFVRVAFSLNDFNAFFVPMVFYFSYFLFSLPASIVAKRLGLKRGLSLSILVSALGVAMFGQFVAWRIYGGALTGLLTLGAGLSLMQVVINPLVSLLGPADRAAQRIAVMGISNKIAGILAPIVLATLVMHDLGSVALRAQNTADPVARDAILGSFVHALYAPYLGMAGILVLIAIVVALFPLPNLEAPPLPTSARQQSARVFKPHLIFGFITMFLYVGSEVLAGDAIGTYGLGFGLPLDQTKFFTSLTLTGMLIGYIAGFLAIPRLLPQERYMELSCIAGCLLSILAFITHGYASVLCVALLGVANAMIMPTIFPIAIRGAGAHTALASALLVMSYSGGAVIPQIYVLLKPYFGFQAMFALITLPTYLAIMLYARRYGRVGILPMENK